MANHVARVEWRSDGAFESGKYSRLHVWHFDGGAVVPGSSSPGVVPPPLSDPAAVDPEEALIASASSCHMLTFLWIAHKQGFVIESYVDEAEGIAGPIAPRRTAVARITLRPAIVFTGRQPERDELDRMHHQAHEECFIANSLKTEIVIEPVV